MDVVDLTFASDNDEETDTQIQQTFADFSERDQHHIRTPLRHLLALQQQQENLINNPRNKPKKVSVKKRPMAATTTDIDDPDHRSIQEHPAGRRPRRPSKKYDDDTWAVDIPDEEFSQKMHTLDDEYHTSTLTASPVFLSHEYGVANPIIRTSSPLPIIAPISTTTRMTKTKSTTLTTTTNKNTKKKKTEEEKELEKREKQRQKELKKHQQALEAAAKKELRHFNTDKNILHYLHLVLDTSLMNNPMGPKIAMALQETHSKQEHEKMNFSFSHISGFNSIPSMSTIGSISSLPAILWKRKVPQNNSTPSTSLSQSHAIHSTTTMLQHPIPVPQTHSTNDATPTIDFIDLELPYILLCFDAPQFVDAILHDEMNSIFNALRRRCSQSRVFILVHRLEQYLQERERKDHKQAMATVHGKNQHQTKTALFSRRPIDQFLIKLAVEFSHIGFQDVSTTEEATNSIMAITKAIAKEAVARSKGYISNNNNSENTTSSTNMCFQFLKSSKGSKSVACNSLLASHPIHDPGVRMFMLALCALPSVGPQIAHTVATYFKSLGALIEFCLNPSMGDVQKIKTIEGMYRTGVQSRKIGPKAAKDIVEFMTCDNADVFIHGDG